MNSITKKYNFVEKVKKCRNFFAPIFRNLAQNFNKSKIFLGELASLAPTSLSESTSTRLFSSLDHLSLASQVSSSSK